ncbi:hypothetical protein [Lichenihabitans psoromatis]|uniref:hypothetical protein n=1 Tax=Lichenihabitans psoromatis TaxID=2528642 RepID=UPI0010383768|nr:hypothetical protein [Lichenihabitans psoromatis]
MPNLNAACFLGLVVSLASVPVGASAEVIGVGYKVVRSGDVAPMGFHYQVSHECRSLGPIAINLVVAPLHGEVLIKDKVGEMTFGGQSAYSACNARKITGVQVYYRSAAGYVGFDRYVVERVLSTGNAELIKVNLSVR